MGDKTYLYGDTSFDFKELTALIHFYQAQGYQTKTGQDIDEEEGFIGDYYLDITWAV